MDSEINKWLLESEIIQKVAQTIHNERLEDDNKNLALQRTGIENLPLKYITDKGWYKQYQYMLLLKSESEVDLQRLSNLDWLDDLVDWLEEKNKKQEFPKLKEGKKVKEISCANGITYQENEDGTISVYSLQIYVNVRKEG